MTFTPDKLKAIVEGVKVWYPSASPKEGALMMPTCLPDGTVSLIPPADQTSPGLIGALSPSLSVISSTTAVKRKAGQNSNGSTTLVCSGTSQ